VIARGIGAGDQVVTTGFARLKDGASVSVAAPEEQPPNPEGSAPAAKTERRGNLRTACAADIQKFCANVERRSAIRACLQASASQLSEACRAAAKEAAATTGGADAKARAGTVRKAEGDAKE
jgi:multidrug efflux system membrane fusion protein